jgi:hypothetical protein
MWNPDQPRPRSGDEPVPEAGLPSATFEWVWNSIGVRYGHFFAGKWDGFELSIVKEDWRLKLGDLTDRQLQFGLDNLPIGRPPADCGEFRELCLRAPAPVSDTPRLPPKRGKVEIPPEVRSEFERLRPQEDEEPLKVRGARNTIATLEARKVLGDVQREALAAARRVVKRYDDWKASHAQEKRHAVPPSTDPAAPTER